MPGIQMAWSPPRPASPCAAVVAAPSLNAVTGALTLGGLLGASPPGLEHHPSFPLKISSPVCAWRNGGRQNRPGTPGRGPSARRASTPHLAYLRGRRGNPSARGGRSVT